MAAAAAALLMLTIHGRSEGCMEHHRDSSYSPDCDWDNASSP